MFILVEWPCVKTELCESGVTRDTPYGHTLLFVLCSLYLKPNVCLASSVSLPTVLSMMGRQRKRKGPFVFVMGLSYWERRR